MVGYENNHEFNKEVKVNQIPGTDAIRTKLLHFKPKWINKLEMNEKYNGNIKRVYLHNYSYLSCFLP